MCSAKGHVRSTPESGHVRCTITHVRFVPIADMGRDPRQNTATRGRITLISVNSPGCVLLRYSGHGRNTANAGEFGHILRARNRRHKKNQRYDFTPAVRYDGAREVVRL